ncbi:formimidoylglutamate deiminase [Methylobrevis albus]|uniref:formimidoylglutamate deiminase n=1 Tax=Methylobrevis albus TaxID=2793297 RepID=UPI002E2A64F0|nr:formimidoylglutamate deiminase [Methylobrevis albus]
MTVLAFDQLLTAAGWQADVAVTVADGRIAAIGPAAGRAVAARHAIGVPGIASLHSHAFQRGMAGLAEVRGPGADSFWSWRETMYRFALTMTPDDVEAVAAQLYAEMLEAGFTRVGEFHYLHHDHDGRPYADPAEMAVRIAAAAETSGIGLTLLPVFYAHAGFGGTPPGDGQRRFVSSLDLYDKLLGGARRAVAALPGAVVGVAPHSLRAVTPEELGRVVDLAGTGPVHIHVAEQVREVEDCLAWSGRRPVALLLDHAAVDARWCLIHATHMDADEVRRLAASGAVAGLCPITEANLGDGIFPGAAFLEAGGRYGVGSDSNVEIGVAAELRQLEYAQRLATRSRNVMTRPGRSTGRSLFDAALAGGGQALGVATTGLAVGAPADIVTLGADHPALAGRSGDAWLDGWIFSTGNAAVDCVYVGGKPRVSGGRHAAREKIAARFAAVMRRLAG